MKLAAILVFAACCAARADFSYQETMRQGRASFTQTRHFHASRMATYTKNRATVVDLDKETVTEIDFAKKTYATRPLAERKQTASEGAPAVAKQMAQTRTIGVLRVNQVVVTAGDTSVDCWLATVPGYDEARSFLRKLGEKAGYGFALPRGLEAFAEASKKILTLPGAPVESTWKLDSGETFVVELSDLVAAPVPASKFDVPAGFKPAAGGR